MILLTSCKSGHIIMLFPSLFSFWFIPVEMDVHALKYRAFFIAMFSSMIRRELEAVFSSF